MKPTVATLKAFIRRNRPNLLIRTRSRFDGMIDGCRYDPAAAFAPALPADREFSNNLGIAGVWLVGGSRDRIQPLDNELGLTGFRVYNCCGTFDVAVKAQP